MTSSTGRPRTTYVLTPDSFFLHTVVHTDSLSPQDKILGNFACRVLLDSIAADQGFSAAASMTAEIKALPAAQWPSYCASQYESIAN
jgi:hypothetical protein